MDRWIGAWDIMIQFFKLELQELFWSVVLVPCQVKY